MFYYIPSRARIGPILALAAILIWLAAAGSARADRYSDYQTAVENAEQAQVQGDNQAAFRDFATALREYPNADLPKKAIVGMLGNGLPQQMDLSLLAHLPAGLPPCAFSEVAIDAGDLAGQQATIVSPARSLALKELSDPENGWPFDHVVYVYRKDDASSKEATLLCTVHYQVDPDHDLAVHVGSLLFLLREAYVEETGRNPLGDSHPFDVWLCRRAPVSGGGEEWRGNLYFYDTADSRSSIEWIREIAHEYSHLAFAAIGGSYTAPEAWANGYIGERLMVRWLARGAAGGPKAVERAWGGTFAGYPNFKRILITPVEKLYVTQGPSEKWLARRDALGMRYLIGFLLWVDDRQGSRFLGDLMANLTAHHQTSPQSVYSMEADMARHLKPSATAAAQPHESA